MHDTVKGPYSYTVHAMWAGYNAETTQWQHIMIVTSLQFLIQDQAGNMADKHFCDCS